MKISQFIGFKKFLINMVSLYVEHVTNKKNSSLGKNSSL